MRSFVLAGAACVALTLGACTAPSGVNPPTVTTPTPTSVCQAIANTLAIPAVQTQLASVDSQSAVGQLATYAKSGCNGNQPIAGVNASWTQQVWAEFLQLAPTVLPLLVSLV